MIVLRFFLLTKFGLFLTLIGVLSGSFYGWLYMHDKSITDAALNAYNTVQQQIYQKKEEEFVQKTETISNDAVAIASDVNKQNDSIQSNLDAIQKKAVDDAPDEKRPSSAYLKSVIEQLNKTYGAKK
jgi:hypothetical protein